MTKYYKLGSLFEEKKAAFKALKKAMKKAGVEVFASSIRERTADAVITIVQTQDANEAKAAELTRDEIAGMAEFKALGAERFEFTNEVEYYPATGTWYHVRIRIYF